MKETKSTFEYLFLFDKRKYDKIKRSRKRYGATITVGGWPFWIRRDVIKALQLERRVVRL